MRRLLVVLLLAVGLVPVVGGTAWACSCAGGSGGEGALYQDIQARSAVVYVGTVLDRTDVPSSSGSPGAPAPPPAPRYRVRVDRALKDVSPGTVRTIDTPNSSCGVQLSEGRAFVAEAPAGHIDSCTGTTQVQVDYVVSRYLHFTSGLAETGPSPGTAVVALLLVSAAVGGARNRRLGPRVEST